MKIKIKTHSLIDVITNSSSEIFCTIKGKTQETIEEMINEIVKEFGCTAVEFRVYPVEYENKHGDYIESETDFEISYDYECNHEPCQMMLKRFEELFGEENIEYN